MNFSRFQSRPRQTNPQDRNFGSDLHEFMEGLSKIAQIMYTSIPIIECIKIASKYSGKFFEFIGSHFLQKIGVMKAMNRPEVLLEAIWKTEPRWKMSVKYSSAIAVGVILFCLLSSKPEIEEWKEEEKKVEVLSVEDRPVEEDLNNEYQFGMY